MLGASVRRRRPAAWPTGVLLVACVLMVAVTVWIGPGLGPLLSGVHRAKLSAASISHRVDIVKTVVMKTTTRGLLDLEDQEDRTKYLMVQCHRGQFSNRLMCLKAGVLLARALRRVLVMPMFTDTKPVVDVSKYVSLQCLRRNAQAVTFDEFRQQICRGVGLDVPRPGDPWATSIGGGGTSGNITSSSSSSSSSSTTSNGAVGSHQDAGRKRNSAFCDEGATLYVEDGYSLADYRSYGCWNRREDITNARDLGVEVGRCTHVAPANATDAKKSYSLADIRHRFADLPDKVLLFLDLFGVNLLPDPEDLERTVDEPAQMCGWIPTEAAAATADAVMQLLIPGPAGQGEAAGGQALAGTGVVQLRNTIAVAGGGQLPDRPPPVRLRGERRYAAVHLRRADWFYYCGGVRRCFYSMAEAGAWLNATLASQGLDTLYVSTNADEREKLMLRRAVSGRVFYWEDVETQLHSWRAKLPAALEDASAPAAAASAPPAWLQSLPLDDELMVQMVEKSICMQASYFVSSSKSTFSLQIRDFRNGGLETFERDMLVRKFGDGAVAAAAAAATAGLPEDSASSNTGSSSRTGGDAGTSAAGESLISGFENGTYLCDRYPPEFPDERRLPDYHNPQILMEQLQGLLLGAQRTASRFWRWVSGVRGGPGGGGVGEAAISDVSAIAVGSSFSADDDLPGGVWLAHNGTAGNHTAGGHASARRPLTLSNVLLAPWRALVRLVLTVADGHAMAAANRFVDMYTGGAMVGLLLEGTLAAPAGALADCVVAAAADADANVLHVSMVGMAEEQQVLVMQELEARFELRQITRIGGPEQERASTFTLLWRGDGLSRHAEPALLEELPTFLERVDSYVLAKSRVLLGDPRGAVFQQLTNMRRLFGFDDPRDGTCRPSQLV